jgi:hypothetical protein
MAGAGLVLLAVAAVLTWAVDVDLPYVDDATLSSVLLALGLTLVVAGALLAAARADGSDEGAAGLGLLTLGMVLVWGLEVDVPQVEDTALGVILMLGGLASVAATVYLDRQRTRTRRVVELRRTRGPRSA